MVSAVVIAMEISKQLADIPKVIGIPRCIVIITPLGCLLCGIANWAGAASSDVVCDITNPILFDVGSTIPYAVAPDTGLAIQSMQFAVHQCPGNGIFVPIFQIPFD